MEESVLAEQRRVCLEYLTYRRALGEVGMQAYWDVVSATGMKSLLSCASLPPLMWPKGKIWMKDLEHSEKWSVLTGVHLHIPAHLERKAERHEPEQTIARYQLCAVCPGPACETQILCSHPDSWREQPRGISG